MVRFPVLQFLQECQNVNIYFSFRIPILFHPSWRNVLWLKSWVKIAVLGVAGMEKKNGFYSNHQLKLRKFNHLKTAQHFHFHT